MRAEAQFSRNLRWVELGIRQVSVQGIERTPKWCDHRGKGQPLEFRPAVHLSSIRREQQLTVNTRTQIEMSKR